MAAETQIKVYLYRGRSRWLEELLSFNIYRKVADCWDELPVKAALAYAGAIYCRRQEIFGQENGKFVVKDPDRLNFGRVMVLFFMLRIRGWVFRLFHKELIHSLLQEFRVTDFLFNAYPCRNFIPYIRSRKFGKLYGPENFDCFRGNEFAFADEMFIRYRQGDPAALDKLIAILYRKAKPRYNPYCFDTDGDRREPFNMHTVDARLPDVRRLAPARKALIAMWYAGCRQQWTEQFPNVFPKAENTDGLSEQVAGAGWLTTLRNLSGGKFGDMENTLRFNMYLILCEAEDLIKQAREIKGQNGDI